MSALAEPFFRCVARASLNAVGFGVAGDFAVDVLPEMARRVWGWWGAGRPPAQLRDELAAVAAVTDEEAARLARAAVAGEGGDSAAASPVVAYLSLLPA